MAWFSRMGWLVRFIMLVLGRFGFTGVGFVVLWLLWWFMVVVLLTRGFMVFGLGSGLGSGMWSLLGFRQTWVIVGVVVLVVGGGCWLLLVWGWVLLVVVLGFLGVGLVVVVVVVVIPRSRFTVRVRFCSALVLLNMSSMSFLTFFPIGLDFRFSCWFLWV